MIESVQRGSGMLVKLGGAASKLTFVLVGGWFGLFGSRQLRA